MFYVWVLLSHNRYQYDSLILSKQTWAYPRQHLQQLLWCVVSVRLNLRGSGGMKTLSSTLLRKLCVHYANGFWYYVTLKVSISFIVTLYTWVRALWIEFNNCPTRWDLFSLLHFCRQLYMFRVLTPIIRSSYNCNYSFWYWLNAVNKIRCY